MRRVLLREPLVLSLTVSKTKSPATQPQGKDGTQRVISKKFIKQPFCPVFVDERKFFDVQNFRFFKYLFVLFKREMKKLFPIFFRYLTFREGNR
jgi:hypothetical protein